MVLTTVAVVAVLHSTLTVLNTEAPVAPVAVAMAVKATTRNRQQAALTPEVAVAATIGLLQHPAVAATLHLHITDHKDCHGTFCKSK